MHLKLPTLVTFLSLLTATTTTFAAQPNFIFFFSDDHQADGFGAAPNPHIETPHLDALAKEGLIFDNNYLAGSFSGTMCYASRAMLMTGRHWRDLKDKHTWKGITPFPRVLENNGYHSHVIGKWHNTEEALHKSFKNGSSVFIGGMTANKSIRLIELTDGKLHNKRVQKGFSTEVLSDAAVAFLKKPQDKPFFLYVAYTAPHDVRNPPMKYREMYYKKNLPLPDNFMPLHPFDHGAVNPIMRDENFAPWPRPPEMVRDQIAEYYGLITHMDEHIGRVMKALNESKHADNTYVIFSADNGIALGRHGLMGKQNLYEHTMKVPLIIKGPGVVKDKHTPALSTLSDLYPTILSLAGIKVEPALHTHDLSPVLKGEKPTVRDNLFLGFESKSKIFDELGYMKPNMKSIRDDRYKLVIYPDINHRQLYDLKNDPHETKNLYGNPEHAKTVKTLIASMTKWKADLGDTDPLEVENPLPKEYDHTKFKRWYDGHQVPWILEKYFKDAVPRSKGHAPPGKTYLKVK